MAKTEKVDETPQTPDPMTIIAQAMQLIAENQPKKVITEGSPEYQEQLRKEGFFDTFPKPVVQNGRDCAPRGLSQETRDRASSLRPGVYLHGKVSVEALHGGGVHLKYKSKSAEDRMATAGLWRDFPDLIDKIWAEMHVPA